MVLSWCIYCTQINLTVMTGISFHHFSFKTSWIIPHCNKWLETALTSLCHSHFWLPIATWWRGAPTHSGSDHSPTFSHRMSPNFTLLGGKPIYLFLVSPGCTSYLHFCCLTGSPWPYVVSLPSLPYRISSVKSPVFSCVHTLSTSCLKLSFCQISSLYPTYILLAFLCSLYWSF